jgi:hypothetical protein
MTMLLDDIVPAHAEAATADLKSFVDMKLVQQLEASGLIKQLYKRGDPQAKFSMFLSRFALSSGLLPWLGG